MDEMTVVNLQTALDWARLGYRVFPCAPDKRPIVKWQEAASTNREVIESWWMEYPFAIPGLVTEDLLVIDADRKGGRDGVMAFRDFCTAHSIDTSGALRVQTPSGGEHFLYRTTGATGVGNHTGSLPPGIDVRSEGKGYIIAPGTLLADGRRYRQLSGQSINGMSSAKELNLAPESLVRQLSRSHLAQSDCARKQGNLSSKLTIPSDQKAVGDAAMPSMISTSKIDVDSNQNMEEGRKNLQRLTKKVADSEPGCRNNTLNKMAFEAGRYVASGCFTESEAAVRLFEAASECGLVESDGSEGTRNTITSGLTAGIQRACALGATTNAGASGPQQPSLAQKSGHWIICGEKPPEPPKWLVKNLLPQSGIASIVGPSGTGKSAFAMRIAAHIVRGEPIFDCEIERRGGVLILAAEGSDEIDPRFRALQALRIVGDSEPIAYTASVPRLLDESQQKLIRERIQDGIQIIRQKFDGGVVCVIVDTLAAAAVFDNENDNAEAQKLMNFLRELAIEFELLVIVIDHFGKSGESGGSRGASSKDAAADVRITLRNADGRVQVSLEKIRGSIKRDLGSIRIESVEYMKDDDGHPVTAAVAEFCESRAKKVRAGYAEAIEIITGQGQVVPGSNGAKAVPFSTLIDQMQLKNVNSIKRNSIETQVKRLIQDGFLDQLADQKKHVYRKADKQTP